jgi:hypothetical protein
LVLVLAAGLAAYFFLLRDDESTPAPAGNATVDTRDREYETELPGPMNATGNATAAEPAANATMRAAEGAKDIVTPGFIEDLAEYAAANYHPAGTRNNAGSRGMSTLSFKKVNMRYGVDMTGLEVGTRNVDAAREKIFSLVLNPIILRTLYNFFADDFINALVEAGLSRTREFRTAEGFEERRLNRAQVREMLLIYSRMAQDVGLVFRSFAANPGLAEVMGEYMQAKARVHASYGEFAALEAQGRSGEALDRVSEEIRTAIIRRENLKQEILHKATPRGPDFSLSQGEVLDIVGWIHRRVFADPERHRSMGAMASLFQELSGDLEKTAGELREQ